MMITIPLRVGASPPLVGIALFDCSVGSAIWRLPVMIITIPLRVGDSPPRVGIALIMTLIIMLIRLIGIVIPGLLSPGRLW